MENNLIESPQEKLEELQKNKKRHPYTLENTPEETVKRMKSFHERAAKLLEKINAGREAGSR
jgi:hypothetical protein